MFLKTLLIEILGIIVMNAANVWACSVCFGQADAKTISALKWGMLSLLATVMVILSLTIVFIVQFSKRARLMKL